MLEKEHARAGHLVRRMNQIAQAIFLDETAQFGLTSVQYAALNAIAAFPDIDQATLSGLVAFDKTTLVKVLDRLAAKELITRTRSVTDRRRHVLNATSKGQDIVARIVPHLDRAQERFLAPLAEKEQAVFLALMTKVVNINNIYSRVPMDPLLSTTLLNERKDRRKQQAGENVKMVRSSTPKAEKSPSGRVKKKAVGT